MEKEEYERLRRFEEKYWWHVGRRDLLAALLRRHVERLPLRMGLDIGCGTGSNLALLEPYGQFFCSEITSELYRDGRPRPSRPLFLARGEALPLRDDTLGICTFFDVLEHIDDDVGFLREVRRVLAPGGWVLLSVPAYPFLWSEHDVSLHHKRRYVRSTLNQAVQRGGLEIVRMTYGMTTMFPLIAGYRLLTKPFPKKRPPRTSYVSSPGPLNQILSAAIRAEARFLDRGNLPFGTSLFCLAQKSTAGGGPPADAQPAHGGAARGTPGKRS